jgi:hypothetical protein
MSKNFSSISQVLSSSALEQKKDFEAILPRPALDLNRKMMKVVNSLSVFPIDQEERQSLT